MLTLISAITTTGMFWLYGALALAGFFSLRRYLPETRGRRLEAVKTVAPAPSRRLIEREPWKDGSSSSRFS